MVVIGLTGGSGTGKGAVSSAFQKHNFAAIDTDAVYHELISEKTSPCLSALATEFGSSVITEDGILNRHALADIVFADGAEDKLKRLNKITHSFVLDEVRRRIPILKEQGYLGVLVDAPLLFESGFNSECDIILCVVAKKDTRIRRIRERDGITREMAERRISSQLSDEYLSAHSDFTIINDGDLSALEEEVEKIANIIKNKF